MEDKVQIPSFSAAEMAARVNTYHAGVDSTGYGDVTLSGTYDFEAMGATRENPFVWHVKGNLKTSGNVALKGYVMFLVEGNATFNGNLTAGDRSGKTENSVAVYVDGEVSVGGTVNELWMQAYAKSGVSLDGNAKVYGNVATSGQVKTTGSPTIKYLPASAALANVFEDPFTRLELLSYREY